MSMYRKTGAALPLPFQDGCPQIALATRTSAPAGVLAGPQLSHVAFSHPCPACRGFPPESFDSILLDGPCTALGIRPRLIHRAPLWELAQVTRCRIWAGSWQGQGLVAAALPLPSTKRDGLRSNALRGAADSLDSSDGCARRPVSIPVSNRHPSSLNAKWGRRRRSSRGDSSMRRRHCCDLEVTCSTPPAPSTLVRHHGKRIRQEVSWVRCRHMCINHAQLRAQCSSCCSSRAAAT